jgi:hypothetical protein
VAPDPAALDPVAPDPVALDPAALDPVAPDQVAPDPVAPDLRVPDPMLAVMLQAEEARLPGTVVRGMVLRATMDPMRLTMI